jgi:signal transduction histidine kinase
MVVLEQKQKLDWQWLRNLLKLVEDFTETEQIERKIQDSFIKYLAYKQVEIFLFENPEKMDFSRLANSNFFDRDLIEAFFIKKTPFLRRNEQVIFPLECRERIIGLIFFELAQNISDFELELLWSFTDSLASKLEEAQMPNKLSLVSKQKIKEISDSIFNNLKGFLEASLEKLKMLEDQNQQLVELNKMRTELINNVSHELRTPLVSIMGFSNILQRKDIETGLIHEASQQIKSAGTRLSRMIDDLIQLNRASTKGWQINFEKLDIGEICNFIMNELIPINPKHCFLCEFPEDYPLIQGDRKLIRQVLENLLSNAIKYSPNGGEIKAKIELTDSKLIFSLFDQGIGISAEDRERVFERFYRSRDEEVQKISGLGLGLAICKDVVEALNGNIYCHSEKGKGTTFILEFSI